MPLLPVSGQSRVRQVSVQCLWVQVGSMGAVGLVGQSGVISHVVD